MKFLKSKTFSWILVILWMIVIFWLSSMSGVESGTKSKGMISNFVETTIDKTNDLGITDKHLSSDKLETITNVLNYPLRKFMHAGVYLVLSILVLNAFYRSDINNRKYLLAILFCFIYACTDEFHQLFVGRTGQFLDVLIDTLGAIIGCFVYYIITRRHKTHSFR